MSQDFYTVMVIPSDQGSSRTFRFSKRLLFIVPVVTGCALLLGSLLFADYIRLRSLRPEVLELREQTARQKDEIVELAMDVNQLDNRLLGISNLSNKLRVMVGLENTSSPDGIGRVENPRLNFADILKQRENELLNGLQSDLDRLETETFQQGKLYESLGSFFEDQAQLLGSIPSIRPVAGGWFSSGFGMRMDPLTGRKRRHHGLDIAHYRNVPVYATADGVVMFAKWEGGFGKLVSIDHGYGFSTRYGHLTRIDVKLNQRVKRGDAIGLLGSTGRSTGKHLHYEVRLEGIPVNPQIFLLDGEE